MTGSLNPRPARNLSDAFLELAENQCVRLDHQTILMLNVQYGGIWELRRRTETALGGMQNTSWFLTRDMVKKVLASYFSKEQTTWFLEEERSWAKEMTRKKWE